MIIPTILKLKGVVIPLGLVILGAGIAVQPVLTGEISETAVVSDSLSLNGSAGEVQSVSELSSGDSSLTVLEFSSGHSLNASVTSAVPGSPISVAWVAPAGSSRYDWVTIARVGSADDVYGNWKYTYGATSGNFSTAAPSSAGEYEFRYFLNNGFSLAARSQVITISVSATPGPTPTSTPTPSPTPLPSGTPTPTPMPGDSISPEVNIIFPAPGMTVYGITGLSAVAKDNIAVARVEFYINGVFRGYDTMAPFSYGWDTTEGGTAPCTTSNTIYAKAYDTSGNMAQSLSVNVYTSNNYGGNCTSN